MNMSKSLRICRKTRYNQHMSSKSEQETIIRWDEEEKIAFLYTASKKVMRKWTRLGYAPTVNGQKNGEARSWQAIIPFKFVSFRKISAKPRKAPAKGFTKGQFHAKNPQSDGTFPINLSRSESE